MTGIGLFARTRRWRAVTVCISLAAVMVVVCGPLAVSLSPTNDSLVRVALLIPLVPALAIAGSSMTPLPAQESVRSRGLRPLELTHYVAFTALALILMGGASVLSPSRAGADMSLDQGTVAVVRNIFALTGAAMVSYRLLGAQTGWILPVAWTILPPLIVPRPNQDRFGIFTLLSQPDAAFTAFVFALVAWSLGACAAARWYPTRE